ncbi:hypothetical protein ACF0H5_015866 [Mactra antiquata]
MDTSCLSINKTLLFFIVKFWITTRCQTFSADEIKHHYIYTPPDIQIIVDSACFVGFSVDTKVDDISDKTPPELVHIYDGLHDAFGKEESVVVGLFDSENFVWPSGKPLKYKNFDDCDEKTSPLVSIFPKRVKDRTCLSVGTLEKPDTKPYPYDSVLNIDSLIQFVNQKCDSYRNRNGNLNIAGLHRQEILSTMFHVHNVSDLSTNQLLEKYSHAQCTKEQCKNSSSQKKETETHQAAYYNERNLINFKNFQTDIPRCNRIEIPSKSYFFHNHLKISKPVIIKNAIKHWPALFKWTNEYFKAELGDRNVHLKLTPSGEFEGIDHAGNFQNFDSFNIPPDVRNQLLFPDLVVVRPATVNLNMSEFIDVIESVSSRKRTGFSAYLEYSSITNIMPDLENDIEEMPFFTDVLELKHRNIWLSDGNTLGKLHFDQFDNFLCQLSGRKQVILYDPHDNRKLYESHIPEAMLGYNKTSQTFTKQQLVDSTSMVMSPVDIQNPNLKRFPLFGETYPMNCTIDEGEVLYIPAFWWHEVQSYPNIKEGRNLAVNFWYEPFLQKEFPCQECKLDVNPKYRYHL